MKRKSRIRAVIEEQKKDILSKPMKKINTKKDDILSKPIKNIDKKKEDICVKSNGFTANGVLNGSGVSYRTERAYPGCHVSGDLIKILNQESLKV